MKTYLSKDERGKIIRGLSKEQRQALFQAIRLTYKSMFGNILADHKGSEEWEFVGYIDHGKVTERVRCECGQPLRYQFIVKNKKTKKTKSLGVVHLQEELNIPAKIAKAVNKGIQKIDYDLDEILTKYKQGWKLPSYIQENLEELPLKEEIKTLLGAGLPILERHVHFLTDEGIIINIKKMNLLRFKEAWSEENFNRLSEEGKEWWASTKVDMIERFDTKYGTIIEDLVKEGYKTSEIAQTLIEKHGAPSDTYYPINNAVTKTVNYERKPFVLMETLLTEYMTFYEAAGKFTKVSSRTEDHGKYVINSYSEDEFIEVLKNCNPYDSVASRAMTYGDYRFRKYIGINQNNKVSK